MKQKKILRKWNANGRLTQHKRFVPYGTHPNFALQKLLLRWKRYMKWHF